jgi:hypothetical protein
MEMYFKLANVYIEESVLKKLYLIILTVFLSNCASHRYAMNADFQNPAVIIEPSGGYSKLYAGMYALGGSPPSYSRNLLSDDASTLLVKPGVGYLKVYPFSPVDAVYSSPNSENVIFSPYKIYRKNGQLVETASASFNSAEITALLKGEYVVVIYFSKDVVKKFWVKIEPGMITEINNAVLAASVIAQEVK